jgi:hypothetical protein
LNFSKHNLPLSGDNEIPPKRDWTLSRHVCRGSPEENPSFPDPFVRVGKSVYIVSLPCIIRTTPQKYSWLFKAMSGAGVPTSTPSLPTPAGYAKNEQPVVVYPFFCVQIRDTEVWE